MSKRLLVLVDAVGVSDHTLEAEDALNDVSLSLNIVDVWVLVHVPVDSSGSSR